MGRITSQLIGINRVCDVIGHWENSGAFYKTVSAYVCKGNCTSIEATDHVLP